jgi:hypothetical protein
MRHNLFLSGLVILGWATRLAGADIEALPAHVVLTGPNAGQRLIVLGRSDGTFTRDITSQSRFASSNPAIASVDPTGRVRAMGDGDAVITAIAKDGRTEVRVRVKETNTPTVPSFRNRVLPMMTKVGCNAGACHGALAGKGGFKLSLRGYDPNSDHFVMTRQAVGRRMDPVEPARSLLLLKPTMALRHGGGQKLEVGSANYQVLADWLAAGAPPPRPDDVRIRRLEVFPSEAVLHPGDALQVLVRAWYSDDHAEDITDWAKFNSNDDSVASVDGDGKARVTGYGEAAVTVWYANMVGVCRIVSPLPRVLPAEVYAAAPAHNFIDDLVLAKLRVLHLPPSPDCDDATFLRRAFLDATGTLPTPEEVQRFRTDSRPNRRSVLIDALLERAEFVDYWAYKWSDLLLVSSHKLSQPAVWSYYRFVRQAVAENRPWDRFARDILTASGNNLENGAVNYFVLHKDVAELTEASAITFLGTALTCCRCHNHPLEKWTQDEYWATANLFARVVLKNGDHSGEIVVQSSPRGDVLHPRKGVAMPPTPPGGPALPVGSNADRRAYFVDWLTAPDNPYFARAIVNRVWRNFMGRGLVEAEDDLRDTNPATNDELLQALAKDFVAHRYDIQHLVRTIMNSATYQRSAQPLPGNAADQRFYSHYLVRRLPAEVILDGYSQVTGVPTPFSKIQAGTTSGTENYSGAPLGTRAQQLPDSLVVSGFLEGFGRPERGQTCACERQQESTVGQALHLNNGQTLNDKLRDPNSQVERWLRERLGTEEAVRRLFLLALSRDPTPGELKNLRSIVDDAESLGLDSRRQALEDLFWAVLTSREFLFNH